MARHIGALTIAATTLAFASLSAAPPGRGKEPAAVTLQTVKVFDQGTAVDYVAFADNKMLVTSAFPPWSAVGAPVGEHVCWDTGSGAALWRAKRTSPVPPRLTGNRLVYVDQEKTRVSLRLLDTAARKESLKIDCGDTDAYHPATALAASPGGTWALLKFKGDFDGKITTRKLKRFDLANGKELPLPKLPKNGTPLLYAPDGSSLVADIASPSIYSDAALVDPATGKTICRLPVIGRSRYACYYLAGAFSGRLETPTAETSLRDTSPGAASSIPAGENPRLAVAISLKQPGMGLGCLNVAAPSSAEWTAWQGAYRRMAKIALCDPRTGKALAFFGSEPVSVLAFSPDGRYLAAGNDPQLTAQASGARVYTRNGKPDLALPCNVQLWDVANRKLRANLVGPKGGVLTLAFSPDGTRLASGAHDGKVCVWDLKQLEK